MSKMPLVLSLCLAVVLSCGPAVVADDGFPILQQPASSRTISFGYQDPAPNTPTANAPVADAPAAKSPSDVAPPVAKPATESGCATCTEPVCPSCGCRKGAAGLGCRCGAGAAPWTIPQPCVLQNLGIKAGGWVQQGITFNSLHPADGYNGPVCTNDRDREYQLNQAWLYLVKPTKTDGCGWDLGGRVDVVYGTDWRFGQCFGLENRFDDVDNFYGLILPQFYMEVAVNNLTVKMGHFATFTSLEVVPAPLNFFYSHALLMAGYFDPLLVTGLQADYKLNDNWTAVGGFNRGWQEFEDPTDTSNFLGGVKWAGDDKRANLSLMVDSGPQVGFAGLHDRNSVITVFTYKFSDRLQYGSQYTAGIEANGSVVRPGEDASWYGTEQLFTYQLNPKWAAGLRYEWVRDNDGSRVAGIGNVLLTDKGWNGQPGCAGAYNDLSLGLNYRPNLNCVLRPEVRWDWYDGAPNGAGELPFGNHTKSQQFTFATDLIVTF